MTGIAPTTKPLPSGSPAPRWLGWAIPAAILLAAAALRLAGINKSLWIDEASSYAQASARDFLAMARDYDHPPAYFALLRLGLGITQSFTLLRLFSVGCGLSAVAMFCFSQRRDLRAGGWCAALMLAASPGFVSNAQELRQYAMLSLELSGALVFALCYEEAPQKFGFLLGLAVMLALAVSTHLLTVFFIGALAAVLGWRLRHSGSVVLLRTAGAFLPALILFVFFHSIFLLKTAKVPGLWWMPPVSGKLLANVFGEISGGNSIIWVADACARHLSGSGPAVLAVSAVAAAYALWIAWGRASVGMARPLLALAAIYWSLLIGYSLTVVPIIWPRTMLPGMLPFLLGLGFGIAAHPQTRQRAIAIGILAALAATMTVPWWRGLAFRPVEDLQGLTKSLRQNLKSSDLPIFVGGVEWGVLPYWPDYEKHLGVKVDLLRPLAATLDQVQDALARQPAGGAVLLVYRDDLYLAPKHEVLDNILNSLSRRFPPATELWNRDYYHIVRFGPPPTP